MMGWGDVASVEVGPGPGAVSVTSSGCTVTLLRLLPEMLVIRTVPTDG
jgi:hypothetical protein